MFDKLVVSSNEPRKARTARFFVGTVVAYLAAVTAALALSVVVSNPKLADTDVLCKIAPPPAAGGSAATKTPKPRIESQRQDLTRVLNFDDVVHRTQGPPTIAKPNPPIGPAVDGASEYANSGQGDGHGIANGTETGIGIEGGDRKAAPPTPVPPAPTPVVDNTPKTVRLISTVLQGKAVIRRTPPYPPLARPIHLQGAVSVEVIVSPEGRVESARAISGPAILAQAAVDAAREWRFEPTLLNGNPVRVTGVITFVFKLD